MDYEAMAYEQYQEDRFREIDEAAMQAESDEAEWHAMEQRHASRWEIAREELTDANEDAEYGHEWNMYDTECGRQWMPIHNVYLQAAGWYAYTALYPLKPEHCR